MTSSHDDAGGQSLPLYEPQVARMLLEAPDKLQEYFIRTGSAASLPLLQKWGQVLQLGIKYQCDRMVTDALQYMLSTSGHFGEAKRLAVHAAVGQVRNSHRKNSPDNLGG